jgi:hypothetical protein
MIIKLNKPLNLFVLMLSGTVMLSFIPQQVDARGGHRGGGGARSSVNRGGSHNRNTNVNRNKNTNVNRNKNVNRNVNRNVNVDVDVNHRHGCCGGGYHPVATGVAVGAAIAVTAAVIGSSVYTLPAGCTTVIRSNVSYRQCGSTWYEPRYSGNDVTYIVIAAP